MATEKQLLSRIQLRYDSYANWTSTTLGDGKGAKLVLKAGEVGICTIPAGTTADGIQNPPHVMFKVGDGTSTFAALPWTSAKAADVHAWAKQASLPVSSEGSGNAVTAIAWDAASNGIKFTLGETFATAAELAAVEKKVTDLNDTYATDAELAAAVKTINEAIATKLSNADFETFKTANTKAISDAKDAAISAAADDAKTKADNALAAAKTYVGEEIGKLDKADSAVAGKYVSAVSEENGIITVTRADLPVDTLVTGTSNGTVAFNGTDVAVKGLASAAYVTVESLNNTAKGYADAAQTAAEGKVTALANGAVKANTEAIEAMKNGETGVLAQAKAYADTAAGNALTSAQGYADQEIGKVNDAIADVIDGTTPVAKATDADKLGGTVAADYATKAYADQAEADALSAAKTYTDEVKKAILTGDSTTELKAAYDTLVEIQEWIEGAGVNATELTEAIAAEAKARGDADTAIDGRLDDLEALVGENGKVSKAEVADVANSLSESAKAEVKEVKVDDATHADAAGKVDNALTVTLEDGTSVVYDGSVAKSFSLVNLATKAYADQAEADAIATAATDAKNKADKALEDAKKYADGIGSGSLDDAKDYADSLIEALDYTDAAVAGKYVSAVQEVNGKIEVSRADLPTYTLASGSKNGSVAFNGTDVSVTGLKSAAYTESSAYATAAQGALADSALQSVEVGTGLKVSAKAENKQTVEIDTDVIFVLYGGTASEVI